MYEEQVRVRIGDLEKNVGKLFAEVNKLQILDEPTHRKDGQPREETRNGGRPVKEKTSVDEQAAAKKSTQASNADTAEEATE